MKAAIAVLQSCACTFAKAVAGPQAFVALDDMADIFDTLVNDERNFPGL